MTTTRTTQRLSAAALERLIRMAAGAPELEASGVLASLLTLLVNPETAVPSITVRPPSVPPTERHNQTLTDDQKSLLDRVSVTTGIPSTRFLEALFDVLSDGDLKKLLLKKMESPLEDLISVQQVLKTTTNNRLGRITKNIRIDEAAVLQRFMDVLTDADVHSILSMSPSATMAFSREQLTADLVSQLAPIIYKAASAGARDGIIESLQSDDEE